MNQNLVELRVSEPVRQRLDQLVAALVEVFHGDLVSVLVHGSAVRGGWHEGRSDVDLVVVLRDDDPKRLQAVGHALALARYAARIEAMILLDTEIPRAADAFPLLYHDIRGCHAIIYGVDAFAGLGLDPQHLRLRIEQELRDHQIRLRRVVTDAGIDLAPLRSALRRKVRQLRAPLAAALRLLGGEGPSSLEEVYIACGATFGVESALLLHLEGDPLRAADVLRHLLKQAIARVDRWEERGGAT